MNHIFISYSRKNEALVSECVKRLRAKNIEVWQDVSGSRSGIPCSVKWRDSIEEAIYGSACAVIFKTEAWEASGPCHKEEEMLAKLAIPRVSLSIASDVLERPELADWIVGTILTKYDKWRQDPWFETRPFLLSRIYRLRKGARFREVMDRSSIHERRASTLLTLKKCREFAASQPYKETFPELLPEIDAFLKKGRNAVLKAMAIRAAIGILGIAGIIVGRTIWGAYEQVSGQATDVFLQNVAMEIVNETAEYDPVGAMSLLTSENWFSTDPENTFLRMNYPFLTRTMSGLLKENYPAAIEENGNQDLFSENGEGSPDFEVTASETDGMVSVLDRRTGVLHQLLLNGPASAWAFSEDGDFMAVSSCENAYVVSTDGSWDPVLLDYNFEDIEKIAFDQDRIAALTDKGKVVSWDNPLKKKVLSGNIDLGEAFADAEGNPCGVYIREKDLVLNRSNRETVLMSLSPEEEFISDRVTLSADKSKAMALIGKGDAYSICVCSLEDMRELVRIPCQRKPRAACFSMDGQKAAVISNDPVSAMLFDISTGQAEADRELDMNAFYGLYEIIPAESGYVISDNSGYVRRLGTDLEPLGDWMVFSYVGVPVRRMILSAGDTYLCMATRGGTISTSNVRMYLETGSRMSFYPLHKSSVISNTAAAFSGDGTFVAFGGSNGRIYIEESHMMNQIWDGQMIPEQIDALSFTEDQKGLIALGKSGTVYRLELGDLLDYSADKDSTAQWDYMHKQGRIIYDRMYDLGLTYITPDAYDME